MTTVPERDPAEWYTEHDSAAPSAAPETEHRNGVTSIHTLLGSGFSRGTTGSSVWGSGGPNGVWGSGSPNGGRSFFPRLSSLGRPESSPTRAIACAASSDSPSRSDEEGPSSSRAPSSAPSEPVSLPARLKRFARPEASDRPELAYLDAWTGREVDEQGQELAPPTPPPRRSLSLGAAVAPKEQLAAATAAEAEDTLRRVADEAVWKQAPPEQAAGTGSPPPLGREASTSPPMSPTSPPAMTTTVSGSAQRCVLQCGLELVIVLASFVDIDFLHQVQRRRPPPARRAPPRTAACPPLPPPPAAPPSRGAPSRFRQGWCRLRLTPHLEHAEGEAPYPATVMAHFRRRRPAPPSPAASQPAPPPAPPASCVANPPPAACACRHAAARAELAGSEQANEQAGSAEYVSRWFATPLRGGREFLHEVAVFRLPLPDTELTAGAAPPTSSPMRLDADATCPKAAAEGEGGAGQSEGGSEGGAGQSEGGSEGGSADGSVGGGEGGSEGAGYADGEAEARGGAGSPMDRPKLTLLLEITLEACADDGAAQAQAEAQAEAHAQAQARGGAAVRGAPVSVGPTDGAVPRVIARSHMRVSAPLPSAQAFLQAVLQDEADGVAALTGSLHAAAVAMRVIPGPGLPISAFTAPNPAAPDCAAPDGPALAAASLSTRSTVANAAPPPPTSPPTPPPLPAPVPAPTHPNGTASAYPPLRGGAAQPAATTPSRAVSLLPPPPPLWSDERSRAACAACAAPLAALVLRWCAAAAAAAATHTPRPRPVLTLMATPRAHSIPASTPGVY